MTALTSTPDKMARLLSRLESSPDMSLELAKLRAGQEWTFTIVRDGNSLITEVKASQEPLND